jgi:hypothetical protein
MRKLRLICAVALLTAALHSARAADDILDAMDQAHKAYQAGDMATAKQQLDLASQLIGQKNAEGFVKLLPEALPGWNAEKAQAQAIGAVMFGGASSASRSYSNAKGDHVDISITGDSAMLMQFATLLNNPALAGAMGKLVKVGGLRAIQNHEGDVIVVVGNKFVVNVQGSADAETKLAYANAVDLAALSKM